MDRSSGVNPGRDRDALVGVIATRGLVVAAEGRWMRRGSAGEEGGMLGA